MMHFNIRTKQWIITSIVHHLKKGDLSEFEAIASQPKTKACHPQHVFLEIVYDPSGTFILFHFMSPMEIIGLALKEDAYVAYRDGVFRQQPQHTPGWGMLLRTVKNLSRNGYITYSLPPRQQKSTNWKQFSGYPRKSTN